RTRRAVPGGNISGLQGASQRRASDLSDITQLFPAPAATGDRSKVSHLETGQAQLSLTPEVPAIAGEPESRPLRQGISPEVKSANPFAMLITRPVMARTASPAAPGRCTMK